jgi:hypothetical protein
MVKQNQRKKIVIQPQKLIKTKDFVLMSFPT